MHLKKSTTEVLEIAFIYSKMENVSKGKQQTKREKESITKPTVEKKLPALPLTISNCIYTQTNEIHKFCIKQKKNFSRLH